MPLTRKDQETLLISLEREEEYINNMLQQSLQRLVHEKIEIENAIEQEQEFIVNTMSRQLTKALNDKLWVVFSQSRKNVLIPGITETAAVETDDTVNDSSCSSDSEYNREMRGKQQVRMLETSLNTIKQQIRTARDDIKKCKG